MGVKEVHEVDVEAAQTATRRNVFDLFEAVCDVNRYPSCSEAT